MKAIIVLFNLEPGVSVDQYDSSARATDRPSGAADAPYQYVEVLHVESVGSLNGDIAATPVMAEVARRFREFAQAPAFITTEPI